MKILNSTINMNSSHISIEKNERNEQLTIWAGDQEPEVLDLVDLTPEGRNQLLFVQNSKSESVLASEKCEEIEISDKDKLKIRLLESFIETLTGKKVKIKVPKIKIGEYKANQLKQIQQIQQNQNQGWGLIYDYSEYHYEKESVSFYAKGIIKTADGREINIDLQLNMTREFMEQKEIHIRAGDAQKIDPLVINFSGNLPGLTDLTFSFDLDADGKLDQISSLKEGSGFLALDLNNDKKINDGNELFGPQSGNGFSELAKYDEDNNNWIDENDSIFNKLRIWTKDSLGNDYLLALGEVGVGAIYLGNINTVFSLNGSSNQNLGEIQKTGLFLRENGTAGTIQHVDLFT